MPTDLYWLGSEKARAMAADIIAAAPLAIASIKELIRDTEDLDTEAAFKHMRDGKSPIYKQMLDSADAIEGPTAFAEKREPVWKGC